MPKKDKGDKNDGEKRKIDWRKILANLSLWVIGWNLAGLILNVKKVGDDSLIAYSIFITMINRYEKIQFS
jgi:hypothetical protein